jgi:orotate phosphoribosyltransferase
MQERVLELLSARRGHFLLESGHHGDLWLDLESLCLDPQRVQVLAAELAKPLSGLALDAVCGPLVEGGFVALMVALQLGVQFTYSERFARSAQGGLFPAGYKVPDALRGRLKGRRVAIVNDVINAGSAVRATFADLQDCGADIVAIGTLLVLGSSAGAFASERRIPLVTIGAVPNSLWTASECPLCASNIALEDVASFAVSLGSTPSV